jgi:hypothetical protein
MEGLLTILRAAHCRSTHHYFAIDALRHIRTEPGRQLARMLLKYHTQYLAGAKDPDTRFRDFQNQVLHVADNHWGGAPRAAERWYGRLQQFLRTESWADAAHAAGVLSHYFTDPLQPLHTAQSPRESVVHRPLEWSICKSYHQIMARWRDDRFRIVFRLSSRPDWLAAAILRGAELAHQSYDTLVATYDLEAAKRDPSKGLSEASMEALAELFGVAVVGWSRILERTALEAEGNIPDVSLAPSAVLASIKIPYAWVLRRIDSGRERQAVSELLDYYLARGELGPHVPDEVRLVRRVLEVRAVEQARNLAKKQTPTRETIAPVRLEENTPEPARVTLRVVSADLPSPRSASMPESMPESIEAVPHKRQSLTLASSIVDAPSIGPKTAARFERIGIMNIGQFLGSSPEQMVRQLRVRWIGVVQIADWQAQTRMMMSLAVLRVRDAQLLVGVGCRTTQTLEAADANELHEKLLRYSASPTGKRSLRGAAPPTIVDVHQWINASRQLARSAA